MFLKTKLCRLGRLDRIINLQIGVQMPNLEHLIVPKFPWNDQFHSRESRERMLYNSCVETKTMGFIMILVHYH